MRRSALIGLALILPVILVAADVVGQWGWEQSAFEDTCFKFVSEPDRLPSFTATPAIRALAVAQRRQAVTSIGQRAKTYFASQAFRSRWAESHGGSAGGEEQARQEAQMRKQISETMTASIQQMEQMLPLMPPAQQKEMKRAIAKSKAEQAKQNSKEREGTPSKDPKVALRKALQHFLAATDGIDYAAAITVREGRRTFTNPAFESKPAEWKMAYRAGREASEEARNYVRVWIAELK